MFNELVNLYCSYKDMEEYYLYACRDWNWKEKYNEYHQLSKIVLNLLEGFCNSDE